MLLTLKYNLFLKARNLQFFRFKAEIRDPLTEELSAPDVGQRKFEKKWIGLLKYPIGIWGSLVTSCGLGFLEGGRFRSGFRVKVGVHYFTIGLMVSSQTISYCGFVVSRDCKPLYWHYLSSDRWIGRPDTV